jgi:Zinc-binding dehydrogenase
VRQQARPSVKTQNRADLVALKALVEAGKVAPVIGGTYPLSRTPEAIAQVAAGHVRGTLVIAVPGESDDDPAADNAVDAVPVASVAVPA